MKLNTTILTLALMAVLPSFSQVANASTAYYVRVADIYVRPRPQSYAMGRLYKDERMDVQYIDANGWAYGYAYGFVNRCLWAQFRERNAVNFSTHGTEVSNRCSASHPYLADSDFTNTEIWHNSTGNDGLEFTLKRPTNIWDNWVWGGRWGNHRYRGTAPAGAIWKIRYTTKDGGGVMARRCRARGDCDINWVFIERGSIGSRL